MVRELERLFKREYSLSKQDVFQPDTLCLDDINLILNQGWCRILMVFPHREFHRVWYFLKLFWSLYFLLLKNYSFHLDATPYLPLFSSNLISTLLEKATGKYYVRWLLCITIILPGKWSFEFDILGNSISSESVLAFVSSWHLLFSCFNISWYSFLNLSFLSFSRLEKLRDSTKFWTFTYIINPLLEEGSSLKLGIPQRC